MLWLFVALQAMAPFIHAHAGAVPNDHGGFLHLHQGMQGDAAYDEMAADEYGAEVAMEQGVRLRDSSLDAVAESSPTRPLRLLRPMATRPGTGFPISSPLDLPSPEHTLPHALAPPSA